MSFKTGSRADAAPEVPQYLVPAPETIRMNLALGSVVRDGGGPLEKSRSSVMTRERKMEEKRGSVLGVSSAEGDRGRGLLARRPVQLFPPALGKPRGTPFFEFTLARAQPYNRSTYNRTRGYATLWARRRINGSESLPCGKGGTCWC